MKRPWQIWLLFAICLAGMLPTMGWLTVKVLELDRAQQLARQEAELERLVSQTLWNMDYQLTPLVGQEAARPYFVYQSFNGRIVDTDLEVPTDGNLQASPILVQPDDHVLLNFQILPDGTITSPQCPPPSQQELARAGGNTEELNRESDARLAQLGQSIDPAKLLAMLPLETLPQIDPERYWLSNATSDPKFLSTDNFLGYEQQSPAQQQTGSLQSPFQQAGTTAQGQGQGQSSSEQQFFRRNQAFQGYTEQLVGRQRLAAAPYTPDSQEVAEGIVRPLWLGDKLILARRVMIDGQEFIQGCWFNWPRIQEILLAQVAAGLPEIELRPIDPQQPPHPSRALVTLPVELVVPSPQLATVGWSPLRMALAAAWAGMLTAAIAAAALLLGVVRLSERRGEFVSAVTHELRTPLTTFRMYAEMLAEGMVPEERRRPYLETLRSEADRLSHLVENVLSYARLERGRKTGTCSETTCSQLIEQVSGPLRARAVEAGLELAIELPPEADSVRLTTDAAAVEQILFNLVDNACKYAADGEEKKIDLSARCSSRHVLFVVRDYGSGIGPREARQLFRPFSKSCQEAAASAPGVGLGLALCRRLARQLGGRLDVTNGAGPGARFTLTLPRQPA